MIRIAISGKANSGKNTVLRLLTEELGLGPRDVRDMAFADQIKEGVLALYPTAKREFLFGPSALRAEIIPGTNVTYRQVLLDLGAQARRYNEDHWVDIMVNKYAYECQKDISERAKVFILSDLRFVNEYQTVKKLDFVTVRVRRDGELKLSDVSETNQDKLSDSDFDFVVDNNSTLDVLRQHCKLIAMRLKDPS